MKWFLATVLLIAGMVWCQDEVLNNLQGLQENTEFQEKSEDVEKVIKDKCVKAGGEKAFDELQIEKEAVMTCFQNLVDMDQIQGEIDEAKKTGSMDEVFAKYCKRKPEFLSCFNNFTNKLEKCLLEGEKNTLKIGVNLTETLIDFACYKDGDRLAMFIAEGGQECLTDRKDGLQDCFNKSMKNIIPSDFSLENIPLLVIGESECAEFTTLQHCFVKELETCKDKTPANLMEAFFKFIRKSLPCSATERQALAAGDGGPHYHYYYPPPTVKYNMQFQTTSRPLAYRVYHTQQQNLRLTPPSSKPRVSALSNTQQVKNRSAHLETLLLQKKLALADLEIAMAKERRQQNEREHLLRMDVLQLQFKEHRILVELANYTLHVAKRPTFAVAANN